MELIGRDITATVGATPVVGLAIFTFVGEVLLIGWLFWVALKGFRAGSQDPEAVRASEDGR
jgi:hypothetical protein